MKYCTTWLSRVVGLMFQKPKPLLMVFNREKIIPIHTWFMQGSIDVYYLDANKNIVERTSLAPWKVYTPKKPARYILEVPSGMPLKVVKKLL